MSEGLFRLSMSLLQNRKFRLSTTNTLINFLSGRILTIHLIHSLSSTIFYSRGICLKPTFFPGLFKLWRSPLLVDGVSRKPTAADATWSVQQRHTCHVSRAPDAVAVSYRSRFRTMMLKWAAVVSYLQYTCL